MKFINSLSFLMLVCLLLFATSCRHSSSPGEDLPEGEEMYAVAFTVSLDRASASRGERGEETRGATRGEGSWGNHPFPTELGTTFDNKILSRHFSAALYRTADLSYVAGVRDISAAYTQDNGASLRVTFSGKIDATPFKEEFEKSGEGDYKVVLIANSPHAVYPDLGTDTLEELDFNYTGKEGEFPAIPMWGVRTVTLNSLTMSAVNDLGSIPLLRAMGMVRVSIDLSSTQPEAVADLLSLTLSRHNDAGLIVPSGWSGVDVTTDLKIAETLRENRADDQRPLPIEAPEMEEGKLCSTISFYLPEICNSGDDDELRLEVEYRVNGQKRTGTILFRDYEGGLPKGDCEPYNVVRNHIYEFNIYRAEQSDTYVNAAVRAWRKIDFEYDY